jgi:hypothetical protein
VKLLAELDVELTNSEKYVIDLTALFQSELVLLIIECWVTKIKLEFADPFDRVGLRLKLATARAEAFNKMESIRDASEHNLFKRLRISIHALYEEVLWTARELVRPQMPHGQVAQA